MCRLGIGGPFTHLTKEDAASAKVWIWIQDGSLFGPQAPKIKPLTSRPPMMPVIVTEITGIVQKPAVMCVE